MILTNCAACAAPLAHDAPRCVRCKTRYCNKTCQHDHWRRGHKQICKRIHRGGNAEQYHADKKYKEAVAEAVEACADDTKGQTCFICTQALHWKTKEGLVRMCACRGTAGFVHVSCLAEQAKILVAEGEENNLDMESRWDRWYLCSLCEQEYHGAVHCALGWACWKTYVDRPEADMVRINAMTLLGNGLFLANHHEDSLPVREAQLSMLRRIGASEDEILLMQGNLALAYHELDRTDEALALRRQIHSSEVRVNGPTHINTLSAALNLSTSLTDTGRFAEARAFMPDQMALAKRVLGSDNLTTLNFQWGYARAFFLDKDVTAEQLAEPVAALDKALKIAQRVLGNEHPSTCTYRRELAAARILIARRRGA